MAAMVWCDLNMGSMYVAVLWLLNCQCMANCGRHATLIGMVQLQWLQFLCGCKSGFLDFFGGYGNKYIGFRSNFMWLQVDFGAKLYLVTLSLRDIEAKVTWKVLTSCSIIKRKMNDKIGCQVGTHA